ncbi:MAG: HIT family protein [Burkholderiales bacterium]|nr:HIT family protein [Burkholderiales bacterium]
MSCVFCLEDGGQLLFRNNLYRIILVADKNYPGFIRVIANAHVKELTDLSDFDNLQIYNAVIKVEKLVRSTMNPTKINLASFGNMTPHVHWHIIPRFENDLHFPNPIWGNITNQEYTPLCELQKLESKLIIQIKESFN